MRAVRIIAVAIMVALLGVGLYLTRDEEGGALSQGVGVAQSGYGFQIPEQVIRTPEGTETVLAQKSTPEKLVGYTCSVQAVGNNEQPSVHPGNDLLVTSRTGPVFLRNVERSPGAVTDGDGTIVLGQGVIVTLKMGPDGVYSGGFFIQLDCEAPPSTTTTSLPPQTTTTVPETTTTTTTTTTPDTTVPPTTAPPVTTVPDTTVPPSCPPGQARTGDGECVLPTTTTVPPPPTTVVVLTLPPTK